MTIVQRPVYIELDEDIEVHCPSDCLLCDRLIPVEFKEGVLVHMLGNGDFAHCMQDTHHTTRTVQ